MEMKFKYYALILNIHRNFYSYFYSYFCIIIITTTNPQGPPIPKGHRFIMHTLV